MQKLRINEAIALAKEKGIPFRKLELAKKLWPDSDANTAKANLSNLIAGRSKKVTIDAVPLLCAELGVTADFLFGLTSVPSTPEREASIAAAGVLVDGAIKALEKAQNVLK